MKKMIRLTYMLEGKVFDELAGNGALASARRAQNHEIAQNVHFCCCVGRESLPLFRGIA